MASGDSLLFKTVNRPDSQWDPVETACVILTERFEGLDKTEFIINSNSNLNGKQTLYGLNPEQGWSIPDQSIYIREKRKIQDKSGSVGIVIPPGLFIRVGLLIIQGTGTGTVLKALWR